MPPRKKRNKLPSPYSGHRAPELDQLEVSLFGPGFGECALIHIGSGKWIVIDSCSYGTNESVAISYLQDLGINPATSVVAIIVTHWHDDHVRGISKILEQCSAAIFIAPLAMTNKEFIKMTLARKQILNTAVTSGVDEISAVFRHLNAVKRQTVYALADRQILKYENLDHKNDCIVHSLSPSDAQCDIFMKDLASMMPDINKTESRCMSRSPNNLAVATWIAIGPVNMLFGADLEETKAIGTGWSVVVSSKNRPSGKASIFKVPHHGSENGHNLDVWNVMLAKDPIALLTPYAASKLPKSSDVSRIKKFTNNAYITSVKTVNKTESKLNPAVKRTLKEAGLTIRASQPSIGHIRLRNDGVAGFDIWKVELFAAAAAL